MANDVSKLEAAVRDEDTFGLASNATAEELERLKAAEALFDLRRQRSTRGSRFFIASQVLVGYVALLGLGVNAYQSYTSQKQLERQQGVDQDRWSKEFERSQRADKYRAFFETSLLATDAANREKRLVGYALLEEFVVDEDYNNKATLMLEESLLFELRSHTEEDLDDNRYHAVEAILMALAQTPDCRSLERAAQSIDRVAQHRINSGHQDEGARLFGLYVRRLVGRAVAVCPSLRELKAVREPIQKTLVKVPQLAGLAGEISSAEANERIAQVLRSDCTEEALVSGVSECPAIFQGYAHLCSGEMDPLDNQLEQRACAIMKDAAVEMAALVTPAPR